MHGSDSTGTLWISRALDIVYALEKDSKHVTLVTEDEEIADEVKAARKAARDALGGLSGVAKERKETAKGLELLIQSVILQSYDEPEESIDVLEELQGCAAKMFAKKSTGKKARKTAIDIMDQDDDETEDLDPIDLLVDVLIGFLERASSQLRALASQVFGMLSGEVTESTVDLLLAQLESRPVTAEEEDELLEEGADDDEENDDEEEEEEDDSEEEEDEEDDSGDVDPELRKRIAEALQVNGADAAEAEGGEDSDSEDELLMDDDQMLALDDKLAEIFKSQVMGKKGKKDAQREAVHFKNRVLDIIETFVKKQPTSPLILRLVLPLLEIILNSGPTELHLSSKATGILVNRICKSKDVPSITDRSEALEILGELHVAARKAQSAAVAKTCSQCSVFLARALLQDDESKKDEIVAVYLASLEDFMTKKTTKVKAGLFFDLVQRFPVVAWEMREQVLKYAREDGANGYRQTQAFLILNEMVGQVPALVRSHCLVSHQHLAALRYTDTPALCLPSLPDQGLPDPHPPHLRPLHPLRHLLHPRLPHPQSRPSQGHRQVRSQARTLHLFRHRPRADAHGMGGRRAEGVGGDGQDDREAEGKWGAACAAESVGEGRDWGGGEAEGEEGGCEGGGGAEEDGGGAEEEAEEGVREGGWGGCCSAGEEEEEEGGCEGGRAGGGRGGRDGVGGFVSLDLLVYLLLSSGIVVCFPLCIICMFPFPLNHLAFPMRSKRPWVCTLQT